MWQGKVWANDSVSPGCAAIGLIRPATWVGMGGLSYTERVKATDRGSVPERVRPGSPLSCSFKTACRAKLRRRRETLSLALVFPPRPNSPSQDAKA